MSDETSSPDPATLFLSDVLLKYIPESMHELPEVQGVVAQSVADIIRGLANIGWSKLSHEEHLARFKDLRDAAEMQGYQDGLNNMWSWGLSESSFWHIYKTAFGKGMEKRRLAEQAEIDRYAQEKPALGPLMTPEEVEAEIEEQGYEDCCLGATDSELEEHEAYQRGYRRGLAELVTKEKVNASS